MKKNLVIFSFFVYFFFLPLISSALAASNFTTDYKVIYEIFETGMAKATFNVVLTNQSSKFYASSYNVQVGFKNIDNISIKDSNGIINPNIIKNESGNNIQITFTKPVVGINNKTSFSISMETPDISQKSKNIWDINIPGLAKQNSFNSFNVTVITPKSLGEPSYIKPDVGEFKDNKISFTKEELGESGISISFGKEEIYKFDLTYHLNNSNFFPIKTEIALPPSTNYQDIKINTIDPKPLNVIKDKDGNWLAQYELSPSKKINVKVQGLAKIALHPKKEKVTPEELKEYLKEQPYWQTSDSNIKDLAQKLKTPYAIYDYVARNLKYDFSRVTSSKPRVGAAEVLKNTNSAVCLEFTDLFVALARAAGIPAREVNGFAYTQNPKERPLSLVKDILHSWPEYYDYDIQTWVMVDPTWANTTGGVDYFYTLDFDHLTFVKKGISNSYPIPPGGYKLSENQKTKDIHIELADSFDDQKQVLSFSEEFLKEYSSLENIEGSVLIKNVGDTMSSPQVLSVKTDSLTPESQSISFGEIPPYGFIKIPVKFDRAGLLTNMNDTIIMSINENSIVKKVKISPFIVNKWSILGGILIVSIFIGLTFITARSRNLSIFR